MYCFFQFVFLAYNTPIAYFFLSVTRNPYLDNLSGGSGMIRCSDYTYCCEGDDDCHCGNKTNLVIFQAGTSAYTLISESTADLQSSTASATRGSLSQTPPIPNTASTITNAANASPQPQSNPSEEMTKIAIGIGVPFSIFIIGVSAALILWFQRYRKRAMGQAYTSGASAFPETVEVPQPPSDGSSPYLSSHSQQDGVGMSRGFEPAEMGPVLQQPRNPHELENSSSSTAQMPLEVIGSAHCAVNSPSVGSYRYSFNRTHSISDAAATTPGMRLI